MCNEPRNKTSSHKLAQTFVKHLPHSASVYKYEREQEDKGWSNCLERFASTLNTM